MAGRATSGQVYPRSVYRNCNQVAQEQIWKENVKKELTAAKRWEKNWGFMTEFDIKGRPRTKKELPQNTTYYKEGSPVTTSQQYGAYFQSTSTQNMLKFERTTSYHKKKSDLVATY